MTEDSIKELKSRALARIAESSALEDLRVELLGRQGEITRLGEAMREVPKEDRPTFGRLINDLRTSVTEALEDRLCARRDDADRAQFADMDATLPGVGAGGVASTRSPSSRIALWPFSDGWGSHWRRGPTSRRSGIALMRSTHLPTIPPAMNRTHFICLTGGCCAHTPPPCKSA